MFDDDSLTACRAGSPVDGESPSTGKVKCCGSDMREYFVGGKIITPLFLQWLDGYTYTRWCEAHADIA